MFEPVAVGRVGKAETDSLESHQNFEEYIKRTWHETVLHQSLRKIRHRPGQVWRASTNPWWNQCPRSQDRRNGRCGRRNLDCLDIECPQAHEMRQKVEAASIIVPLVDMIKFIIRVDDKSLKTSCSVCPCTGLGLL